MLPGRSPRSMPAAKEPRRAAKQHWAFRPVRSPQLPAVKDRAWPATSVDRFILARLESKGLSPSPPADRRTLIRRATFDLIGLPPTPEEVAAFEADPSPEAYPRLIDRLLASPHHGERWAATGSTSPAIPTPAATSSSRTPTTTGPTPTATT